MFMEILIIINREKLNGIVVITHTIVKMKT